MPCYLTLQNVALATPDGKPLLSDLNLSFNAERTGLVGANGSGKTTLLRVLAGDAEPAGGHVTRSGSIGSLEQNWPDVSISIRQALGVEQGFEVLGRIECGTASPKDFDDANWSLPVQVSDAMQRTGLHDIPLETALAKLSGGQRTRVGIAKLFLSTPDLLLLDEPTNNLDAEGRTLIHDLIANWRGGVIVASHDRDLLEGMDQILELMPTQCVLHGGGWSAFAQARAEQRVRQAHAVERAERDLVQTQRAIQLQREKKARRDKGGKAKRARGDQPKILLDAMAQRAEKTGARDRHLAKRLEEAASQAKEKAASMIAPAANLRIDAAATKGHGAVLQLEGVTFKRERFCLGPIDLLQVAGERFAILGRNGAGKSTLLDVVTGKLQPTTGTVRRPAHTALLDQDVSMLRPDEAVLDALRRHHPDLSEEDAHATLARFAFRNVAANKQVQTLSGGEKLRAGLAVAFGGLEPLQLLVLDEPTNHLDIESVEVLEAALSDFQGAILATSHDAAFLRSIAIERTLTLDGGRACALTIE